MQMCIKREEKRGRERLRQGGKVENEFAGMQ